MKNKDGVLIKRNESLDVLRCVAMLMIVGLHIMGQGGVLVAAHGHSLPVSMLHYSFLCAVNVFMLISGYFGCKVKFRYSRIVILYLQTFFWSVMLAIGIHLVMPQTINGISPLRYIPLLTVYYWFFTAYFIVFFSMPAMNYLVNTWTRKQLVMTIVAFFILFCILTGNNGVGFHSHRGRSAFLLNDGYSPLWLAYVYFLGAFLSKYGLSGLLPECSQERYIALGKKLNKSLLLWGGYLCMVLIGFVHLSVTHRLGFIQMLYTPSTAYNDPWILSISLILFAACRRTRFPLWLNSIARVCAPLVFGVFLIHTQYDCFTLMRDRFSFIAGYRLILHVPIVIGCSLCIFAVCCVLDWFRLILFNSLHVKQIIQWILRESVH